ncbi:hypothetical protein [Haloplanus salilacus]
MSTVFRIERVQDIRTSLENLDSTTSSGLEALGDQTELTEFAE